MKKFIALLSIFILIFAAGCSKTITELDVDKTVGIIEEALEGMEAIEDDSLKDVYELDLDLMDVHIIKQNISNDLYAIIKTTEKTKVKNAMAKYFEKVRAFNVNYSPERLDILDNRVEKEIGDYLIYIVAEDAESIYDKIAKSL